MDTIKNFHPIVLLCYFVGIITVIMLGFNPVYLGISLVGGVLFCVILQGFTKVFRSFAGYFLLFFLTALSNPLFSHNGKTALFFINDNRVTLEAIVYGAVIGLMLIAALYWLRCFNEVFDSEKLLWLFGKAFPKVGLVISMALRFVPELINEFRQIKAAQKSLGIKSGRVKAYLSAFSAVITHSMERSVITSYSMNARGYGLKGRSSFSRFRFSSYDFAYLLIIIVLFVLTIIGRFEPSYYPEISFPKFGVMNIISVISFVLLAFLPSLSEIKEGVKWKLSISGI